MKKILLLILNASLLGNLLAAEAVESKKIKIKVPQDTSCTIIVEKPTPVPPQEENYNPNQASKIDLVFVLDTTGSMSGLIKGAKEKIWSIVNTLSQARPTPEIRLGIIGYRDRGDDYVTDFNPLTSDIDSIYTKLMNYRAAGGGDRPESVNQALHEAISKMNWNKDQNTYRVIFLVGDSPPHMDYQQDVKYSTSCKLAKNKDIIINTVLCGGHNDTRGIWQDVAQRANGSFFEVAQSGGAVIIATPYDKEITTLSIELEKTRILYGSPGAVQGYKLHKEKASKAMESASYSATAQRADFNVSKAGAKNFGGGYDLLIQLENNKIELDKIDNSQLPEKLQKMNKPELQEYIKSVQAKRRELTAKIRTLSAERQKYMLEQAKKSGKLKDSFEKNVLDSIRPQLKEKKISIEEKDLKL